MTRALAATLALAAVATAGRSHRLVAAVEHVGRGRGGALHHRPLGTTVAVAVEVEVPGGWINGGPFVDHLVAVVVEAVAQLFGRRVHGGVAVIAVGVVGGEPTGRGASEAGRGGVAVAVAVEVGVEGRLGRGVETAVVIVDVFVAVVVFTVADLAGGRTDGAVGVVAVSADGGGAGRSEAECEGRAVIAVPVGVVVDVISVLFVKQIAVVIVG